MKISRFALVSLIAFLPFAAPAAQEKQRFASLQEALAASAALSGRSGPANVN